MSGAVGADLRGAVDANKVVSVVEQWTSWGPERAEAEVAVGLVVQKLQPYDDRPPIPQDGF